MPSRYFTNALPLGPNATPDDFTEEAYKRLFDVENEIFRSLSHDPQILIGRRGSGKTAFLKVRHYLNENDLSVELQSSRAFAHVLQAINAITEREGTAFVEDVSDIWVTLFKMTLFREILVRPEFRGTAEGAVILRYFEKIYGHREREYVNLFLTTLVREILEKATGLKDVWSFLRAPDPNGPTLQEATSAAHALLEKHQRHFLVLIDNLEDFELQNESMGRALAGLLKSIRALSETSDQYKITFCLPSELYHHFATDISSNPLKDFERSQLIQWTSRELIHLCTNRYSSFLEIYEPDFYARNVESLRVKHKNDTRRFWKLVFPERIINGKGWEENAIAYILRHTQLSPRHAIMVMNRIISYNIFQYGTRWGIKNESFVRGIESVEGSICDEIFRGFDYVCGNARVICEILFSHLSSRTSLSEIHKVYNTFGRGIPNVDGIGDIIRILTQIGALGRVVDETERYFVGEFEYTLPDRLIVNSQDTLCIHPVFIKRFRVNTDGVKPIYPVGCDIDGSDYRHWVAPSPPARRQKALALP